MKRALLLVNPSSCRAQGMRPEIAATLRGHGFALVEPEEDDPAKFPEIIRAHAGKIDVTFVGGGDGTLNTVIKALREIDCPLAVLPLGTANNFARNLGIPRAIEAACEALAGGEPGVVDLGEVNGHYFLNGAGLGISTSINRDVHRDLKRQWGILVYFVSTIRVLNRCQPFQAEIECDGQTRVVRVLQVTVCNGRHYGAGLTIHPEARIDDSCLDLFSLNVSRWWQGLGLVPAALRGRLDRFKGASLLRGREIIVRTRRSRSIDTDGEITTRTPATFRVLPNALRVILPAAGSARNGGAFPRAAHQA